MALTLIWFLGSDFQTLTHLDNFLPIAMHVAFGATIALNFVIAIQGESIGVHIRSNMCASVIMVILANIDLPSAVFGFCAVIKFLAPTSLAWCLDKGLSSLFPRWPSYWHPIAASLKAIDYVFGTPSDAVLISVFSRQCLMIFVFATVVTSREVTTALLVINGLYVLICAVYTIRHLKRYDQLLTPKFGFLGVLVGDALCGWKILFKQWRENKVPITRWWAVTTTASFFLGCVSPAYCADSTLVAVSEPERAPFPEIAAEDHWGDARPLGEGPRRRK